MHLTTTFVRSVSRFPLLSCLDQSDPAQAQGSACVAVIQDHGFSQLPLQFAWVFHLEKTSSFDYNHKNW